MQVFFTDIKIVNLDYFTLQNENSYFEAWQCPFYKQHCNTYSKYLSLNKSYQLPSFFRYRDCLHFFFFDEKAFLSQYRCLFSNWNMVSKFYLANIFFFQNWKFIQRNLYSLLVIVVNIYKITVKGKTKRKIMLFVCPIFYELYVDEKIFTFSYLAGEKEDCEALLYKSKPWYFRYLH